MRVLAPTVLIRVQEHVPVLVKTLHAPAFLIRKYRYHRMLGRDRRRGAEHRDRMYGVCGTGIKYATQHAAFVPDVMQAAIHQYYVVAASCQVHSLHWFVAHVDTDTLRPGEPFDLLAGYRAHLDRIDLIAELSEPDGIRPLPPPQIQCDSGTAPRRDGKQGGMKLCMHRWVDTVPILTTPPVPLMRRVLPVKERPDLWHVTECHMNFPSGEISPISSARSSWRRNRPGRGFRPEVAGPVKLAEAGPVIPWSVRHEFLSFPNGPSFEALGLSHRQPPGRVGLRFPNRGRLAGALLTRAGRDRPPLRR